MAILTALFTAIFTGIGISATVAALAATTLANVLISTGLSVLSGYLNKPKQTSQVAVKGELEIGSAVPVSVAYGKVKTRGHLVHYNKFGSGNKFNQFVYVLSNGWCDGLEGLIIKGENKPLISQAIGGGEIARYTVTDWGDAITILFFDGRPGQAAEAGLVTYSNPPGRWSASDRLTGCAYVMVVFAWDDDRFSGGIPEMEFILRGLRCYDPRLDSTVSGGAGPHRLADPATWEFSENPAVQRYNFQLGLKGLVSGRPLVGEGLPQAMLDHASYFFSMNAADTLRDVDGDHVPTYVCGLIATSEDANGDIRDAFDNAMAGYGVERSGLFGVIAGAAQSPAMALDASHIRTDAPIVRRYRRPRGERFNLLSGQFTSPDGVWERDSYTPIRDSAAVAADKGVLPSSFDIPQVNHPACAQYVAEIRYRQNRRGAAIEALPVSLYASLVLEVGDWVTFEGRTWLVADTKFDVGRGGTLSLAETSADIYDENGLLSPPVTSAPGVPDTGSLAANLTGLAVATAVVEGAGGTNVPAVAISYDAPDDPTIVNAIFEIRPTVAQTPVLQVADANLGGLLTVSDGIADGIGYEVRCWVETLPRRASPRSSWVATGDVTQYRQISADNIVAGTITTVQLDVTNIQLGDTNLVDGSLPYVTLVQSGALNQNTYEFSLVSADTDSHDAFEVTCRVIVDSLTASTNYYQFQWRNAAGAWIALRDVTSSNGEDRYYTETFAAILADLYPFTSGEQFRITRVGGPGGNSVRNVSAVIKAYRVT